MSHQESKRKTSPTFSPRDALQNMKKQQQEGLTALQLGPSAVPAAATGSGGINDKLAEEKDNNEFNHDNIAIPNVTGTTPEATPMLQPKSGAALSANAAFNPPTLTFQLAAAKKSTTSVRDVSNLALWGLNPRAPPTQETAGPTMLVDSPQWAFLKSKFQVKHVIVVYCNGITYEQILSSSALNKLLLKPLRRNEFFLKKTSGLGGDTSSGSQVQLAPLWVNSTKNNLEHDFFFRYERRNPQQQGGSGGGGRSGDSGPSTNYNNRSSGAFSRHGNQEAPTSSTTAGGAGKSSPGASPQLPPPKTEKGGAAGLKQFVAALKKADETGSTAPKSSEFFKKEEFKPKLIPRAGPSASGAKPPVGKYGCDWTSPEDPLQPRLDWELLPHDGEETTPQPAGARPCAVDGFNMPDKWEASLNLDALTPLTPKGKGGLSRVDPGISDKANPKNNSGKKDVHMEDMLMSKEDLQDHGFLFQYPIHLEGDQKDELVPFHGLRYDAKETRGPTTGGAAAVPTAVAMDCEMVMTQEGSTLARLTVLAVPSGACLIDMLVKPSQPVLDYVTRYSGITEEMLSTCQNTLLDAQERLQKIIFKNYTYVLGHGLENDFLACRMNPDGLKIVDTTFLFPHINGLPMKNSLKFLMNRYFNRQEFQQGEHDSGEDASACIELVGLKLRKGVEYGRPRRANILGTPNLSKESAVNCVLIDRAANCSRLTPHKASYCNPVPCTDDDDTAKKAVKQFWKLRTAEEQARAEDSKSNDAKGTAMAELPGSFSWVQFKECYFPEIDPLVLNKMSKPRQIDPGWAPPRRTPLGCVGGEEGDDVEKQLTVEELEEWNGDSVSAQEAKLTAKLIRQHAEYEELKRSARVNKKKEVSKRNRDTADAETDKPDPAAVGPTRPEESTLSLEIHKLNLRLGSVINAVPGNSLVLVMASNCRYESLNQMSSAHGGLFGFVRPTDDKYKVLPQNFIDLKKQVDEDEKAAKSCAPQ